MLKSIIDLKEILKVNPLSVVKKFRTPECTLYNKERRIIVERKLELGNSIINNNS